MRKLNQEILNSIKLCTQDPDTVQRSQHPGVFIVWIMILLIGLGLGQILYIGANALTEKLSGTGYKYVRTENESGVRS